MKWLGNEEKCNKKQQRTRIYATMRRNGCANAKSIVDFYWIRVHSQRGIAFWFVFVVHFYKFVIRQTGKLKTPTNPTTMPARETVPWQYKHSNEYAMVGKYNQFSNIDFSLNSKMRLLALYRKPCSWVYNTLECDISVVAGNGAQVRGKGIQGRSCTMCSMRSISWNFTKKRRNTKWGQ